MAEPAAELDLPRAADPAPARASSSVLVHLGLFLACCVTTWWFGGVAFAATLMGILACHESGHFIAARRHGIDASLEMIEVAKKKSGRVGADIDFRVALIEAIPFPDASFDLVTSSLMIHHLPPDLKLTGLTEVHRVLEPGGASW